MLNYQLAVDLARPSGARQAGKLMALPNRRSLTIGEKRERLLLLLLLLLLWQLPTCGVPAGWALRESSERFTALGRE